LGSGLPGIVHCIAVGNDLIYACGNFQGNIVRWDGQEWEPLGGGLDGAVFTIEVSGSNVYVGGVFDDAGGVFDADRIAWWDGGSWRALGVFPYRGGIFFPNAGVRDILVYEEDIYVLGDFNECKEFPGTPYILRYDGMNYNALDDWDGCRSGYKMSNINNYLYVAVIDHISGDAGLHRWDMAEHAWKFFVGSWIIDDYYYDYGDMDLASSGTDLILGHSFHEMGGIGQQIESALNVARFRDPDVNTSVIPLSHERTLNFYTFPCPTSDIVFYSINHRTDFGMHTTTLLDADGTIIFERESAENWIDISHLPDGMYMMELTMPGVEAHAKVLKIGI
jgi:hypothetical protein